MTNLNDYFDALTSFTAKETDVSDYGTLSLVDHDYLEALIAMEPSSNGSIGNNINESISRTLEESSNSGDISAIDLQSSDVLNLVTLLYKAIWNDDPLPVVIKELIGRTQISILKIALSDTDFFDDEQHPGRVIINEFAMAGIAWTEKEILESDPVFAKVRDLVQRLIAQENADKDFLQSLINELRAFKSQFSITDAVLEQRIRETDDHSERLKICMNLLGKKLESVYC